MASLGFLAYIYYPLDLSRIDLGGVEHSVFEPQAPHVVIVAHGLGDTPESWSDQLSQTLAAQDRSAQVIALDWNPYSKNTFRCSVDGKRLGASIGARLASSSKIRTVHLIAHSCGSFVSLGICQAMREQRPDVVIQSTYLDPVSVYGGLFWDYGLTRFGACADFSDAYIDVEDGVPGSNQRLPSAHTFDVTQSRKRTTYTGSPHVWPTVYYQQLVQRGLHLDLQRDRDLVSKFPRGELEVVANLVME